MGPEFRGESELERFDRFGSEFEERQKNMADHIAANFGKGTDVIDNDTKPVKKHRKSAYEWLLAYHNGRRVATGKGLEAICVTKKQLETFEGVWEWPS